MMKWVLIFVALACPAAAGEVEGRARVIDGDTLAIGAEKVRLQGIDAPEHDQTCEDALGRAWPCGAAATKRLETLVGQGEILCEGKERDRYHRLLGTCRAGGQVINAVLVSEGLAEAYRRYALTYVQQEEAARAARRGIWRGAHLAPEAFRHGAAHRPERVSGCLIKGNISKNGKIFHVFGAPDYQRTQIDTRKGERWFCSEAEARAAGWRPARR
ncbi:thermonuclease family protein [Rhodobacter maris]|uniref:Endonuclease YncB( thermonuclease family) n=1 Tax=Rhodobacter maris TaxID=446682 RepID=A0A285SRM8_9RHOB|nr:thermonuclease family protein [Rhodobacter maris]SOC10587.1 endonuclease YncB(thermonuclease family) [Rhodobacter maris]